MPRIKHHDAYNHNHKKNRQKPIEFISGGGSVMPLTKGVLSVTPSEANDFISELDPIILDVRSPQEFVEGHIDGAINLPLSDFNESVVHEKLGESDPSVLVYSNSGKYSSAAGEILAGMGFDHVCNLDSGIDRWPFGIVMKKANSYFAYKGENDAI